MSVLQSVLDKMKGTKRYRIYLTNHDYFKDDDWGDLYMALEVAKQTSFQCSIFFEDVVVASYCPLNGVRYYLHP